MAIKDIKDLQPGDVVLRSGTLQTVEGVTHGEMGYDLHFEQFSVFYLTGTRLLVVDEADAVAEAERIVGDGQQGPE